jgi:hypothetical protein
MILDEYFPGVNEPTVVVGFTCTATEPDGRRQKCFGSAGFGSTGTGRGGRSSGLDVAQTLLVAIQR